uniref:Uncharacterized protein n=1 Tax=Arundo donax TaxID=35708 RepID=A0A0A9CYM5_ARUDO
MNKASQMGLYTLVDSISLAITLRMIRGAHSKFSTSQSEQLLPYCAGEYLVTVRYDSLWHSMEFVNIVKIHLSYIQGRERMGQFDKIGVLRELVHHHKYAIVR